MRSFEAAEEAVARRVKRAREAANLTQVELADALGLSKQGYNPYESHGRFSIPQLFQLSQILHRSVEYFLGIEDGLTDQEDKLLTMFRQIEDEDVRELVLGFVEQQIEIDKKIRGEG